MSVQELSETLDLVSIKDHNWHVQVGSCREGGLVAVEAPVSCSQPSPPSPPPFHPSRPGQLRGVR